VPATLVGTTTSTKPRTAKLELRADGVRAVVCTATDKAGNTRSVSSTVKLNTALPSLTLTPPPDPRGTGWYPTAQVPVRVRVDNAELTETPVCTVDDAPAALEEGIVRVAGDGTHEVACSVTDAGGRTVSDTVTVRVDATAPATTIATRPDGDDGWFRTAPATADVTGADANLASLACKVDGQPAEAGVAPTENGLAGSLTFGSDDTYAVSCTAVDVAGNATTETATVRVDTVAPDVALSPAPDGAGGWYRSAPASVGGRALRPERRRRRLRRRRHARLARRTAGRQRPDRRRPAHRGRPQGARLHRPRRGGQHHRGDRPGEGGLHRPARAGRRRRARARERRLVPRQRDCSRRRRAGPGARRRHRRQRPRRRVGP
jgi:hypothetical protein